MHPFAILFNPYARVYTLRLLLLADIATTAVFAYSLVQIIGEKCIPLKDREGVAFGLFVLVHHLLVVLGWPVNCLAVIDLAMGAMEIGAPPVAGYLVYWVQKDIYLGRLDASLPLIGLLVLLVVSALFRTATICKSKGPFWTQRFKFLGCCMRVHPEYTPLTILLNRSLGRPLVRGESRPIIFVRAVVITCIVLAVPAFAVYTIVVVPLKAQVYTRTPSTGLGYALYDTVPGPATIVVLSSNGLGAALDPASYNLQVVATVATHTVSCPMYGHGLGAQCVPYSWDEVVSISVSLTFLPTSPPVYVRAVQTDTSDLLEEWFVIRGPTLLRPGARLIGVLVWTQREMITQVRRGISTPRTTAFTSEVTSLQTDPSNDTSGSNIAILTLLQPNVQSSSLIQDTVDDTPLSGVATFGGFWTFLNGTFALVFGANVVYFAFGKWECSVLYGGELRGWTGRRPLSALGIVHIFQQRALVRRWHKDFPAIHTEGGTPGSESASVAATW
ncbi:hypothetical protein FB451DRAFT_1519184 [Mycena latifolia]|nr:hypothetical protein FB451DRAFT_1519184 [Mycena latifolia]